jgi:hypothetical protein
MTSFAFALVLLSAIAHATWNLLAKRAGRGPSFVWLFDAVSILLYAPAALLVYFWEQPAS